jgi:archaemetzincin
VRCPTRIYLAEIENPLPDAAEYVAGWLLDELGAETVSAAPAVDALGAFDRTRRQYNSTTLLAALLERHPDPETKLLAVTGLDLYIPVLTFVYGEAQLGGSVAIASSYRLCNSFYGLQPNPGITMTRLLKESLHELGHTAGLVHCDDYECVMSASMSVEEIDLKREGYCNACRGVVERVLAPAC